MRRSVLLIALALLIASVCPAAESSATGGQEGHGEEKSEGKPAAKAVRIIEVTDGSVEYRWPIWSPDGKKLAFTGSGFRGTYVRNADGTGPIREVISPDERGYCCPVWSKDSKSIVITRRRGRGEHYDVIDVETGEVRTEAHRKSLVGSLKREIHGASAYYTDDQAPPPDVSLEIDFRERRMWVVEVEDDILRRTEFPHPVYLANLSPRCDLVVFMQPAGTEYVSNLDGSSMVNLGRGDMWDWSQDGKKLVYLGDYRQTHYDVVGYNIFIVKADGSGKTRITDTPDLVESLSHLVAGRHKDRILLAQAWWNPRCGPRRVGLGQIHKITL